jgi:hypothetical protein
MHGNVLLAAMALSVSVFAVVPMLVAGFTSGRPGRRPRARTAGLAPGGPVAGQWHVHRVIGTGPAGAQVSTGAEPARASGSTLSPAGTTEGATTCVGDSRK